MRSAGEDLQDAVAGLRSPSRNQRKFFDRFNKAAPSEANLRKMEKKTFSTDSVLDTKRGGKPKKNICRRLCQ
ncbi:hypothetical protein ANN_12129 [Periplaneta americana]|uniref:Uncharacterized protein n=1 Tax=Periplaneta americana TaxID=6978 RepID=A0ABQ8T8G8_PERAM|nr:hypothetical protein ANN_12129 [Periplaneta americana]